MLKPFIQSLRPYQWYKNLLLFAALIFSGHLFILTDLLKSFAAFIIMCLVAGGVYGFNDVFDRYEDLHHPLKKNRPIAVGTIPVTIAMTCASVLITVAVVCSYFLSSTFTLILMVSIDARIMAPIYLRITKLRKINGNCGLEFFPIFLATYHHPQLLLELDDINKKDDVNFQSNNLRQLFSIRSYKRYWIPAIAAILQIVLIPILYFGFGWNFY